VAGWFKYLNGVNEKGEAIKIDDPMAEELNKLACKGGQGPNMLLSVRSLFGDDLRCDSRFLNELTTAMESLYSVGAVKTLEKYAYEVEVC
jgi:mannitol 2-dehydrogenase